VSFSRGGMYFLHAVTSGPTGCLCRSLAETMLRGNTHPMLALTTGTSKNTPGVVSVPKCYLNQQTLGSRRQKITFCVSICDGTHSASWSSRAEEWGCKCKVCNNTKFPLQANNGFMGKPVQMACSKRPRAKNACVPVGARVESNCSEKDQVRVGMINTVKGSSSEMLVCLFPRVSRKKCV